MDISLNRKERYQLKQLYETHKHGSLGLMYLPTALPGTPPYTAFIWVKRLTRKGLAYKIDTSPCYSLTPEGIKICQKTFG